MATRAGVRRVEIPARLNEGTLGAAIARRLAGDAIPKPLTSTSAIPPAVIWNDGGDEVLVHLASVRALIRPNLILVSVDLQTDQTGRQTLVVPLAVGGARDQAGLVAVTEELPRGHGLLAGRWGAILQDAVWSAMLSIANDYATRLHKIPFGFTAGNGTLSLRAAAEKEIAVLSDTIAQALEERR